MPTPDAKIEWKRKAFRMLNMFFMYPILVLQFTSWQMCRPALSDLWFWKQCTGRTPHEFITVIPSGNLSEVHKKAARLTVRLSGPAGVFVS
jgi:hypothetical protein